MLENREMRGRCAALLGVLVTACAVACCAARVGRPTTVMIDASATVPPQILRQGEIEVPAELHGRSCTSGTAVVEVDVDATGQVRGTRVSRPSSEPAFDKACIRSAQAGKYRAATSHGKAIVGTTTIECRLECP